MTARPFYYASNDAMFKRIFGDERDTGSLVAFLQAVLDLPPEDYAEVSFINPSLARERPEGKQGILDVRVRSASGVSIDIEIQLNNVSEIRERIIYYLSRMVTDQIGSGDDYQNIKRSICILITEFAMVRENTAYHNINPATFVFTFNPLKINELHQIFIVYLIAGLINTVSPIPGRARSSATCWRSTRWSCRSCRKKMTGRCCGTG